jgi:hypothetical protein
VKKEVSDPPILALEAHSSLYQTTVLRTILTLRAAIGLF